MPVGVQSIGLGVHNHEPEEFPIEPPHTAAMLDDINLPIDP